MSSHSNAVTDSEVASVCGVLRKNGINPTDATRGQISRLCKVGDRRARTIREWIRRSDGVVASDTSESHELSNNAWVVSIPKTRICTLEELIEHCKVDLSIWEVERFVVNKWEVGAKNALKEIAVSPLFQVKAWLKKKPHAFAIRAEIEQLKAQAKKDAKPYVKVPRSYSESGNMLEIAIPDLHVGKLAWAKETGWENYDSHIADEVFNNAFSGLLDRTKSYKFDKVVFVVGNDIIHTDNVKGTTTAGTPLDVDGRYQKTFIQVRQMVTRAIEMLRHIAPVDVMMVSGNHDSLSVWHLGDSLECLFAKCPDVTINNDPVTRKYYQWGKTMLMFTHGNTGKLQDYPLVMAVEQPEMFGSTTHREAHTGDKHQLKVQELHGVRVRISPALCPPDKWHSDNMFVGNPRCAEAFVWNKEEGLIGQATYTVPAPVQKAKLAA